MGRLTWDYRRTAFVLIAPAMGLLLAINVFPFLFAVYISFHYWTLSRPIPPRFVGWLNYRELFADERFLQSLITSVQFVVTAVSIEMLLGFALAFAFNAKLKGLVTLRKIALLPIMVTPLATGLVWFYIFNENFGAANWFISLLGFERVGFLTQGSTALLSIAIADVWQWTPFIMLVLFAALQSLPEYAFEAAKMDGLNSWQTFWRVTLPLLRPAIMVVLVLRVVDALRMIELVFLMTKGGPGGDTEVLPWYLYTTGFQSLDLGYAAAMAVVMIILVTIIAQLLIRRLMKREAA
jgi:multiple sugar transport system permease protein